jgi:hypothetical protein
LQWTKNPDRPGSHPTTPRRIRCLSACAVVLLAFPVAMTARQSPQGQQPAQSQQNAPQQAGGKPSLPDPSRDSSSNTSQLAVPASQNGTQSFDALNTDRKKQIADESARLLKLATELKSEVDKTTKDTLSLTVVRKADEIEKLAHNVKEKMRLAAGTN